MADEPEVMGLHLKIRGRVQGVYFRRWAEEEATRRGLRGWIRNRADGSVEAVIFGKLTAVRAMVKVCYQGPLKAKVDGIVESPAEICPADEDLGESFIILPNV